MRTLTQLRNKSVYLLVAGILLLLGGFIIISCGGDPELKVALIDNGPFAVDMSLAPGDQGAFYSVNKNFPDIEGKPVTIEAWVKSKVPSLSANIFGHWDNKGILLFLNQNEPKMAIRRNPVPGEPAGCFQINATSTECIVGSNNAIIQDDWHHIAGVLSYTDHTGIHAQCGGAELQIPHMDIYVDGIFQNCSTTNSLDAVDPATKTLAIAVSGESGPPVDNGEIAGGSRFDGIIDEVRFWLAERTADQIMNCKDRELSLSYMGDCSIDFSVLKGYWRFNEGEGDLSADLSGGGGSGGFEAPPLVPWGGAWVDDTPDLERDPDAPPVPEDAH